MSTNKETKFIAFSTQKGGVGKSTFTALVASILHYRLGYNVAVLDCDFPQHSLMKMRERDLKMVMENETYKQLAFQQFTNINKKAYPVIKCNAEAAVEKAETFLRESVPAIDVVFFDLPGTVNTAGILSVLASAHYIFSPITADRLVLESTLAFTDILVNQVMQSTETLIRSVHLFWNQVDGREKTPLYQIYENAIVELGLNLMKTSITDSKRFRKEGEAAAKTVFRSTLLPADRRLMNSTRLDAFMQEFFEITKL